MDTIFGGVFKDLPEVDAPLKTQERYSHLKGSVCISSLIRETVDRCCVSEVKFGKSFDQRVFDKGACMRE